MTSRSVFSSECTSALSLVVSALSACATANAYDLQGVWASEGYGRVLEIAHDTVDIFDITRVSCVWREERSLDEFLSGINRINTSEAGAFSYYDEGGITRYDFSRLDRLSDTCAAARNAGPSSDPELNFEVFWSSFNENYAFFDTHGIDWDAVYERYRPTIRAAVSPPSRGTTSREILKDWKALVR